MQVNCLRLVPLLLLVMAGNGAGSNKARNALLNDVVDHKDFKKLLRTKTNVLVLFTSDERVASQHLPVFREAADTIRGTGTIVHIDCTHSERKKLCKKLKATQEPFVVRHYKDGAHHKDYDRQLNAGSIAAFMRDPTGDIPWQEDPAGVDVLHLTDPAAFRRLFAKTLRPTMVMFYVTWCGYCKRLKPDYSKAATELKSKGSKSVMAAMNVEPQENAPIRKALNITGFPTLIYFEEGNNITRYEGDYTKAALLQFMLDPKATPAKKPAEPDWSADTNSEIVHLTAQSFVPALKDEKSVLVMFYAPWCGHCKRMKPEYEQAALELKSRKIGGVLAALDATKQPSIAEKYEVQGYPTVKYFVNGQYKFDVNVRDAQKIVEFMLNPQEPPPTPPPAKSWEEEEEENGGEVLFLKGEEFSATLRRKKHALVMFYAPWCGHCKSTKPEFSAAASALKDDPRIIFVAVDCTQEKPLCEQYEVRGYPTIIYFSYLKFRSNYNGGRSQQDFVQFMTNPLSSIQGTHEDL